MVANGLVMSKVCYLIQLWGGCEGYLLNSLQVQLNKAARLVKGFSCFTSTRKLMEICGWLTVKQLVVFQTTLMVHKTLISGRPHYMSSRLSSDYTSGLGSTVLGVSGWMRPSGTRVIFLSTASDTGVPVPMTTMPFHQT